MTDGAAFRHERVLPFPPERVFSAFAAPEVLSRWWGPKGFSNTFEVFEFRSGGRWKYVMHGPKGGDFQNESVFETLEPSRIVIRHACKPFYRLTVGLSAEGDGTRITWVQVFDDPKVAESIRKIVGPANEENLDRLEAALSGGKPAV